MQRIAIKNNLNTEFSIEHKDNEEAISIDSRDLSKVKSVDTISYLKSLTSTPPTMWVSGYHTKSDGAYGSHIFEWDATSTEDDNGGTIIKLDNVDIGRYKLKFDGAVNVKWFGAKGDGFTDDTIAIKATVEYSASSSFNPNVYVPAGKYIIDYLELDSIRGVKIIGEGANDEVSNYAKTWFYWKNNSLVTNFITIRSCAYMNIEDINFYSNGNGGKDSLLKFECNTSDVEEPLNKFASTKINFKGSSFVVSVDDSCNTATAEIKSCLGVTFNSCIFYGKHAMKLGADTEQDTIPDGRAVNTLFKNCTIRGSIIQERVLGLTFSGCYIRENSVTSKVSNFSVSGNEEVRNVLLENNFVDAFGVTNVGISFYVSPSSSPANADFVLTAINNQIQGAANGFIISSGNAVIKNNKFIGTQLTGTDTWTGVVINSGVSAIDVQDNDFDGLLALNKDEIVATSILDNRTYYEDNKILVNRPLETSFGLDSNDNTNVLSRTISTFQGGFYKASYSISIYSKIDATFTAGLYINNNLINGTRMRIITNTADDKFSILSISPRVIKINEVEYGSVNTISLKIKQDTGSTYAEIKGDDYSLSTSFALVERL